MKNTTLILAALSGMVHAQQGAWEQTNTTTPLSTAADSSNADGSGKLTWLGANESGAEWGTVFPGTEGVDYFFPSPSGIDVLLSEGFNILRVPFSMERMAVGGITAALSDTYLEAYSSIIDHITTQGAYAVIDAHNHGRYNGEVITDADGFQTFWNNLATAFKSNSNVIFDINNEYNTMEDSVVYQLNQAGIDGVRAAGATSQYIFVEGNMWSGASTWSSINDGLKTLSDPNDMLIYEMHQYLNSDSSGIDGDCVSTTVGVERVEGGTEWLRSNGKLGVLGEFAGGPNEVCLAAMTGLLDHLTANSDVWMGAIWWAAGPQWPQDIYADFEPPSGTAYQYYGSLLRGYLP